MKSIVLAVIVAILCLSFVAWSEKSELPKDGRKTKINAHAPAASKAQILTVASTTVPMESDLSWSIYAPSSGCKFRTMSTATVAGIQKTVPDGAWHTRGVRDGSAFTNFSGCTLAELERQ